MLSTSSAVQLCSGPSPPVRSFSSRCSARSAVQLESGSSPPVRWFLLRVSAFSAGSLSSGNEPCRLQRCRLRLSSTALHTAASPKADTHVSSSFTPFRSRSSSEQPAPNSSGTTRLANAGVSMSQTSAIMLDCRARMMIERTHPCATTAAVNWPQYDSTTRHGPRGQRHGPRAIQSGLLYDATGHGPSRAGCCTTARL
eukprot:scaffold103134_cov66-Phaeocystis_antarctica.AAC.1